MRLVIALAVLISMLGAGRADASPRAFEATLSIELPGLLTCLDDPPPGEGACGHPARWESSAAGTAEIAISAAGLLTGLTLPEQLFQLTGTRYLTTTGGGAGIFPIYSAAADVANGAGSFGPSGGVMPLAGLLKVCLYAACDDAAVANLSVPMTVIGAGGTMGIVGVVAVTVVGAPWTTASIVGGDLDPEPVAGSAAPGVLNLVTPIAFRSNLGAFADVHLGYARLTLHYVPEPVTAMLFALGIAGLAALARSR